MTAPMPPQKPKTPGYSLPSAPQLPPAPAGVMPPTVPPVPGTAGMLGAPAAPMPWTPQELYGPKGLPIWWQDDPAAHLSCLNEIILDERKPFALRKLAAERSTIYEQLAQAKADPMQPVPAEVIGVPLNRLATQGAIAPPALVPNDPNPQAVGAPGSDVTAGDASGAPMSEAPAPLGTVGDEAGMRL